MDRSPLSKPSSSKRSFLSNSRHELPRWRSPSPMDESMIPPPIVESMYASPSRTVAQSIFVEKPSPLQDRQSELEADLQFLLDAQAEGLVRGLEGGLPDDQTSTGSTTPTAQSVRSASARRTPNPLRRKPGLRRARKGIFNSILALSTVKDDELESVNLEVRQKEQTLQQIDEWEKKKQGLEEATRTVDSDEDTVRVQRLRQEADVLQEDIKHVELQLADMKARHRKLMRQATAVENSVQAKLASYTSSLRMLEDDVIKFLSVKPTEESSRPRSRDGQTSIWQLPAKRRTLEMARQHWNEERDLVVQQRESVEREKSALDEGAGVWREVVEQITDFERRLRTGMSQLSSETRSAALHSGVSSENNASKGLRELLEHMARLIEHLESKFELAKERNWNLLIAAIGAELDALRQGKQLLDHVLRSTEGLSTEVTVTANGDQSSPDGSNAIQELDKSFETARRPVSRGTDSEDDPDPELLFSTHDTDTE